MIQEKFSRYLFWLVIILLSFFLFVYKPLNQISKNISKKKNITEEIQILDEKIAVIDKQLEKYDDHIKKLKDLYEQEKIARNKLKMVKNGEVIYKSIEKQEEK